MRRVHSENKGKQCSIEGCDSSARTREMCSAHYQWWLRRARREGLVGRRTDRVLCEEPGCGRPHAALGLCSGHYKQWTQTGTTAPIRVPAGRVVGEYISVKDPEHPNATAAGYVREHIKVMTEMIGRPLWPDENVHHKNGDKHDNRPENLELWSRSQPSGQRVSDKVAWAREIIARYGDDF